MIKDLLGIRILRYIIFLSFKGKFIWLNLKTSKNLYSWNEFQKSKVQNGPWSVQFTN